MAHPCAYHQFDLPEMYRELGETLCRLKRFDESIEAWEAALASGECGLPHPRSGIADVLLRAGRRAESDALFEGLRRQCPDDIWLRNLAGIAYGSVGEHETALFWLEEGIAMALADWDREAILAQLDEERRHCREALGLRTDDELAAQVAAFQRPAQRPERSMDERRREMFAEADPNRAPCAHCGWDAAVEPPAGTHLGELERRADSPESGAGPVEGLSGQLSGHEPARTTKVGRNEPCPCGSGRKYKHCCGGSV